MDINWLYDLKQLYILFGDKFSNDRVTMYKILLNAINRKKNTIKIITNYIVRYITLQSSNAFDYFYPTMLQSNTQRRTAYTCIFNINLVKLKRITSVQLFLKPIIV